MNQETNLVSWRTLSLRHCDLSTFIDSIHASWRIKGRFFHWMNAKSRHSWTNSWCYITGSEMLLASFFWRLSWRLWNYCASFGIYYSFLELLVLLANDEAFILAILNLIFKSVKSLDESFIICPWWILLIFDDVEETPASQLNIVLFIIPSVI